MRFPRMSKGYCKAYTTYFEECGLSFLIPEHVLEILVEHMLEILAKLGLAFAQMCPNLLRYS